MQTGDWAFVNAVVAVCEDGAVRHEKPFLSRYEAIQWSAWGHACTKKHRFDLTRVLLVVTDDPVGGSYTAVDADGETFLVSFDQTPESYGIREGDGWWSVVQCKLGQPQGGDAHWLAKDIAERALGLYTEGRVFPIQSWHPSMGQVA